MRPRPDRKPESAVPSALPSAFLCRRPAPPPEPGQSPRGLAGQGAWGPIQMLPPPLASADACGRGLRPRRPGGGDRLCQLQAQALRSPFPFSPRGPCPPEAGCCSRRPSPPLSSPVPQREARAGLGERRAAAHQAPHPSSLWLRHRPHFPGSPRPCALGSGALLPGGPPQTTPPIFAHFPASPNSMVMLPTWSLSRAHGGNATKNERAAQPAWLRG